MMGAVTTHATPEPDSVREDGALALPSPSAFASPSSSPHLRLAPTPYAVIQ